MIQARHHTVAAALLLAVTFLTGTTRAGERPGDDFRQAALEHTKASQHAVGRAAHADGGTAGRYLQLAAAYREMAAIKERAAVLADVERWDEINWDRYRELEAQRDAMVAALHDKPESESAPAGAHGSVSAAESYRLQARDAGRNALHSEGAERAIFEELAVILSQMAAIEDVASAQPDDVRDHDRTRYEALSERRAKLERMLEAAR